MLESGNIGEFFALFKSLIANLPHQLHKNEAMYHVLLHFFVMMVGIDIESEVSTNKGRIDMVISTKNRITIFEFKFEGTPQQALEQIKQKEYFDRYKIKHKPITLVGATFNRGNNELIIEWQKEEV